MPSTVQTTPASARRDNTEEQPVRPIEPRQSTFRALHYSFAAFSVLCMVLLIPGVDANLPGIQVTGIFGYAVAVAFSLSCVLRPMTPRVRQLAVWFHFGFMPAQFLFSFATPLPWLGLLGSIAIVLQARHSFERLAPEKRKLWLALHVGFSVGWLGISLAMVVLSLLGLLTEDPELRHGTYQIMHVFDLWIVIPSVVLSIVSGLVVSLGSKWGLVKNWWVLLKFGISLAIPVFATIAESQWVIMLADRTEDPGFDHVGTGLALAVCMIVFAVALWVATWLSVYKPGGKTQWGKRDAERERAQRLARKRRGDDD